MELTGGDYHIGGVPVRHIAKWAGTPVYVYDAAVMDRQAERLRKAFAGTPARFMYACKALTNIAVLRHMRTLGLGLDTVSIEEVEIGLRAGFTPTEILFTPNMVPFSEYQRAAELGVHINIDSIPMLERFGHAFGGRVPVCVRINPHIMAGGNERISTGHIDSKFGISIHQLRHVERIVASHGMRVEGLHMHTGSDILDTGVFLRAAELLLEIADQFPHLRFLDLGSGFKVPYKPDDIATDVEELGERLCARMHAFNAKRPTPVELWFEPGKFLVSEAGVLLVSVSLVKQTTATVFAGVESGLNHLIRPMLYGSYHGIVNVSRPQGNRRIYTVTGYICETDTFAWDRQLPEVQEGDVLAFLNAGAYGFSMASNYNSRLRPAEVLVKDGQATLIRRRESLEDLLALQVEEPIAAGQAWSTA
ncbi:MAG: diaminopimelate decarboxylase [Flavobacteriales bacterium]|nr:diaminopimelate decarboxylase [Flavobacteriales bacterium]MBP9080726.1 diaminopimelate decarboxylase [Flavobacteriales bacterium]